MATKLLSNMVTLADVINEINPDGQIADVVEIFNEHNNFLPDAPMVEANDYHSHISYIRSRMAPVRGGRIVNRGADTTSAASVPQRESIAILERWVPIDERIVKDSPDPQKTRTNQAVAILESMMQEHARQMVYGSEAVDQSEMNGFFTRYNDDSLANVEDLGGTDGSSTSLLMVEWGENKSYMVYPRGAANAGIEVDDKGLIDWRDPDGKPYDAYVSKYCALFGLAIDDPLTVQRISGIEVSGSSNNLLASDGHHPLIRAKNRLRNFGQNAVLYCNRDMKAQFDIWALDKTNGFYMMQNITGQPLAYFQEMPIRLVEQILSTEDGTD